MTKLKTHEQFVEDLRNINTNINVLGSYINNRTKISVKCLKCGNTWETSPKVLLRGGGCPKCAIVRKTPEQFVKELKRINPNIEALDDYINSSTKISVKCLKCNNIWETSPKVLLKGHGCPKCVKNRKKTQEEFVREIEKLNKKIEILGEYINYSTKVQVKCLKCNNIWHSTPNSLLKGSGCPKCANNIRKTQEEFEDEMQKYNKHITILGVYKNAVTPIKVKCNICGNEWEAKPSRLLRGAQCMNCIKPHTSFMEQFIYLAFKSILGNEVLARDATVIDEELDIYIPKYKFAVEPGTWKYHESKALNKDLEKREKCDAKDITLITIYDSFPKNKKPPFNDNCYVYDGCLNEYGYPRLINLVLMLFKKIGIKRVNIDWNLIADKSYEHCHINAHQDFINSMSEVNPNIEILEKYKGLNIPILVNDRSCEHPSWKARPYTLLKGNGCPACGKIKASQSRLKTEEEYINELKEKNPLVSVIGKYTLAKNYIKVKCNICGNEWEAKAYSLLSGRACPKCKTARGVKNNHGKTKKKTHKEFVEQLNKINNSIEIISEYINHHEYIKCHCKKCGNEWEAKAYSLLQGHGCPKCAKKRD